MADHVRDVYRPIIERTTAAGFFPLDTARLRSAARVLEQHDTPWLDMIGRLAADGRLELLLAGFDEPILASLPRPESARANHRMREFLKRRFGVRATGLWLTERVWQPELPRTSRKPASSMRSWMIAISSSAASNTTSCTAPSHGSRMAAASGSSPSTSGSAT